MGADALGLKNPIDEMAIVQLQLTGLHPLVPNVYLFRCTRHLTLNPIFTISVRTPQLRDLLAKVLEML
ncbi:MAG: hypothetical protein JJD98_15585 [Polaromonas sp.]|nr:hypothetical protein [Polaromonas sp.]